MDATPTRLAFPGVHNIRDLGGYPIRGGGRTAFGRIYRGCGMSELDDAGREALRGLGIETVIDLRSAAEREAHPGPFADHTGLRTVALFDGLASLSEMLEQSPDMPLSDRYLRALDARRAAFAEVMEIVAAAPDGPVLFHCTAGKDRTGLAAALILSLNGVDDEAIAEDYARTATVAWELIEALRKHAVDSYRNPEAIERALDARSADMARVLRKLEACYGGARGYLVSAGVSAGSLDRLGSRLR